MRSTGEGYRVIGNLEGTDYVMNHTLWIGVYPGMTRAMLDHMIEMELSTKERQKKIYFADTLEEVTALLN